MDCIFCKIANKEIPSNVIYEDDSVIAFYDLAPQAPTHFLVIPKVHISNTDELDEEKAKVVGHVFAVIAKISGQLGLKNGYRIVNNCGEDGGQTVGHLHFHVLSGRLLAWPPG